VLLGTSWKENPGLEIQFRNERVEQDFANLLKLELLSFEQAIGNLFDDETGKLPVFLSDELAVPTLILKTHKRYRMPRLQTVYFTLLVNALSQYLRKISMQLMRSQK